MIEVLQPGVLTTVQDHGRDGLTHLGISPAGAFDAVALHVGNWLVGNAPNAAAFEMTLVGGRFRFERRATICVTGRRWASFEVDAGEVVDVGPIREGARAYLCVSGGLDVPLVFGSASAHLPSGLGGRALRKGDRLAFRDECCEPRALPPRFEALTKRSHTLRVTPASAVLGEYIVREQSDRMGIRLSGPPVPSTGAMVSEGMPLGAVQVPTSGEPILLGVDAQTTGGYPVVACVISADLPSMAQLRPRDTVHFEAVSFEEARRLAREQAALLRELA